MSTFIVLAAINGFLGVALGAFAAHSLAAYFSDKPRLEANFKTGVQYHFYHALAIAIAVLISQFEDNTTIKRSFVMFAIGILFFSGSLYGFTFAEATGTEGVRWLGAITPIGGIFFVLGWLNLSIGVFKSKI